LQQVKAQSRFWWRVLDAYPPEPPAAVPQNTASVWHFPSVVSKAKPKPALKLEIPRSDRRPRRRATRSSRAGLFALGLLSVSVLAAGAAVTVPEALDVGDLRAAAIAEAEGVLLGLGFGIDQISLSGHRFTSDRDVYDALGLGNARTFAGFDAAAALKRIEALPWVDTAQITREFPGGLRVEVRERRPAAVWARKDKKYLIDATGRVLGAVADANAWQLPRISGEGANLEAAMLFTALGRYPDIARSVERAERVGERRWCVVFANGSRLDLGADREDEGLEEFSKSPELRRAMTGAPYVIDVRTPSRVALRPVSRTASAERTGALPRSGERAP